MASDEIVWQIINQQFCSFKLKTDKQKNFCRNEHNVTGLCNRQSCPLANSRYATVRQHPAKQTLYLYMKMAERAHLPSKTWERVKLSANYARALAQVDERLAYWPKFLVHKCKQRLTRLTQVQMRSRRLAASHDRLGERLVPRLAPKVRHREAARERKAEAAAKLERTIERELVDRLRHGAYGDQPLNVSEAVWKKVLDAMERDGDGVRDRDMDDGIDANTDAGRLLDQDDEAEMPVEYVSDLAESDQDLDELHDWLYSDDGDEDEEEEDDDEDEEEREAEQDVATNKRKRAMASRAAIRKRAKQTGDERPKMANLAW